ncbi:MAG: P-loop NTPase [Candidatus Aenigmarchaeota archaeon]|nr:P-loop NTPase [Candidatus Aenigmarchaeota archaeon]
MGILKKLGNSCLSKSKKIQRELKQNKIDKDTVNDKSEYLVDKDNKDGVKMSKLEPRKIAIVSGKGGIGKTTLAINLGYLLNKEFKMDNVVVDCNMTTPHIGVNLGLYNVDITLNHILKDESKVEEGIFEHNTGIKVIPSSLKLTDLSEVDMFKLPEKLDELNMHVILDSAPGLGREALAAISAADEILFVTQPYTTAVVDLYRCRKIAEKLDKKILGVVVNNRKNKNHELTDNEIEKITEIPVIGSIPYDIEMERALAKKLPLSFYNPKAKSNDALYSLASTIAGFEVKRKKTFFENLLNSFRLNY